DDRQAELDAVRAANATIVRTLVEWRSVAPTRPRSATNSFDPAYRFADLDEFVRNAQQRGMEVLMTIWGTPKWANGGKGPAYLPTKMADFRNFARALATRYNGRRAGYPFVRFYGIWNESNLGNFLAPQFDKNGKIVSPAAYAKLASAGYAGLKAGSPKALVAIGETSSNGKDKPKQGATDSTTPGTFAKLLAQANKKLRFDAWAQHPYPVPVNQGPAQKVRYPNVAFSTMKRFEQDLDKWFGRKNIPIWITEYGNETKPGEPKGVTEAQQAAYLPQAIAMARKDRRVQMFIWFVMQDSQGSLWQSGIYRGDASPKRAQPRFARSAGPVNPVNGKVTVRGGTKNPKITVYLREYCANNPVGTTVGYTVRAFLAGKLVEVNQGAGKLGMDCTVPLRVTGLTVAKKKSYRVTVAANTLTTAEITRTITVVGA
ncbi:MAG TPA: cellulase family glycosylhydrolase, partial [Gaiella sp.]|uniref:cellulase family glycosylhydrolase n=1 Tax=Gaiella sp. TaxID=2663207 RepID=UPI002D7FAEFE